MEWTWSPHAEDRRKQMKVSRKTVLACLDDPEVDYVSSDGRGPHDRVAKRGRIAVAYDSSTGRILTVLRNVDFKYSRRK